MQSSTFPPLLILSLSGRTAVAKGTYKSPWTIDSEINYFW